MKELLQRSSISFFSKSQLCEFLEIKEDELIRYVNNKTNKITLENGQVYIISDLTDLRRGHYNIARLV